MSNSKTKRQAAGFEYTVIHDPSLEGRFTDPDIGREKVEKANEFFKQHDTKAFWEESKSAK